MSKNREAETKKPDARDWKQKSPKYFEENLTRHLVLCLYPETQPPDKTSLTLIAASAVATFTVLWLLVDQCPTGRVVPMDR